MSKSNVAETNRATHGKFIQIIYKIKQNYFSLQYFYHCCPGKKHQGYISVSISMPLWRFRVMGLTLKPVRAGQGIGRVERSGTPVNGHHHHQLTPLGVTDCVSTPYCRPDGAWMCVLNSCRGFTRLRLVTPLPKPWSPLAGLFHGYE